MKHKLRGKKGHVSVYTMQELNQHTASVVQEILESETPALITRRGKYIGLFTPLAHEDVEGHVLAAFVNNKATALRGQSSDSAKLKSTEAIAEELGITLRGPYADRDVE